MLAASALVVASGARAQLPWSAAVGIDNENRYRGLATYDVGPVLRASGLVDLPAGAYVAVDGLWRTRDAGLASAEALAGISGRFDALPAFAQLDPGWGWDLALHRTHYNSGPRYDFTEAMAGLLAPAGAARLWWSPHYFGGSASSLYGEVDGLHAFDDHWSAFAHVGVLRYGATGEGARPPGRTDAQGGIAWSAGRLSLRVARDGLLAGHAFYGTSARERSAGWLTSAELAF